LKSEEELQKFEKELQDRFGKLPDQAMDLFNSVRVKWIAISMGLERVVMKKGKLTGYFISDQQSAFYQSKVFTKVLSYVQNNSLKVKMMEKQTRTGLRLLLTIDKIDSVEKALKSLSVFQK
jgi:transcription-repair coupling factor (superfamily II helicase)